MTSKPSFLSQTKWDPISLIQNRLLDVALIISAVFAATATTIATFLSEAYILSVNFYFDVFSVASLFTMYFFRNKVTKKYKLLIAIGFLYIIIISSTLQYGIISNQKTLVSIIPFLLILALDLKKALLGFLGLIAVYFFISYLYLTDVLIYIPETPVNSSPMFWIISIIVTTGSGLVIMLLVNNYNKEIKTTMTNLEATTAKLQLRDEQRKEHLEEKNIMIQEIHHRVKNNLAVVSGLLELQMGAIKNEELNTAMQKSINRIMSIAKVHQMLYQSEDFIHIPFPEYVNDLTATILSTMNSENKNIQFVNDIEVEYLSVHHGVPLGIIFNELITNSIKYAFATDFNNQIIITASQKEGLIHVRYSDNGVGILNFEEASSKSLGFTLIHSLLAQIEAEFSYETTNSFSLRFSFPSDSID